jgi:hypothetical protein
MLSAAILACLAAGATAAPSVPILGTEALHAGQAAVVRTVFEGTRIDTFSAVILGVMRSGRADGEMILARATSERVERTGVAAGMSGSPVYVDGRLIGALSSGWQFTREPIFGITPIREMLRVLDLPEAPANEPSNGPAGVELGNAPGSPRFRSLYWDDDSTQAAPEARALATEPRALPLPLVCGGLPGPVMDRLASDMAPLGFAAVPGGHATDGGPPADSLVPGAAVAVDVMRGDLQLSAIGTVTYRDGDRVLIFGHPFFSAGDVRLPLSTAEIVTILPNLSSSFKLGVRGRAAGVATQDRRPAVAGRIGGQAYLMPLRVTVRGARQASQTFHYECIEDRLMAPSLVAAAVGASLGEMGGGSGAQTIRWRVRLYRAGAAPLDVSDVEAGDAPGMEAATGVSGPLRFVLGNPYERVRLDSIAVDIDVEPAREQWTLRSARLLDATARAGGVVRVQAELEHWQGGRITRELDVNVPEEVPEGRYVLMLGGASEFTRYQALRQPGRFRPTSLAEAWDRLQQSRTSDALYAGVFARAPEVSSDGSDYPDLPLSVLTVLASAQSAGERGRRGDGLLLDERREPIPGAVRGELLLNITVDRRTP